MDLIYDHPLAVDFFYSREEKKGKTGQVWKDVRAFIGILTVVIILRHSMNYVEKCRFSPISNRLLKLFIALLNYSLTVTNMWAEMAEEKAKLVFFPPKRS